MSAARPDAPRAAPKAEPMDAQAVRARFPALAAGAPEVPLDNAATTHRPQAVLDALAHAYRDHNANVHRATHRAARLATEGYERARRAVARFLGAEAGEVVFTRNATEAINLVARSFGEPRTGQGDVIAVSALEHHSNLVPWQQLCRRTGATLHVLPVGADGLPTGSWDLPPRTRLLALTRVSNALGTIVDTAAAVERAHAAGVPVLLDISQSAAHLPCDDGTRAADFVAFSAHKAYGPFGLGVLRGRAAHLAAMEPCSFGGEMVASVAQQDAVWQAPPLRFEAGTPPVAEAMAFVPALELLDELTLPAIRAHELELLGRLLEGLRRVEHVRVVGPPRADQRSGAVSLAIEGGDVQVAAAVLDLSGIAVRAGFHCAEPLLAGLGCGPTLRASVAVYSTAQDIDALLAALPEAVSASR
jgi:cysteine desulfurase / selenocysteine lyase